MGIAAVPTNPLRFRRVFAEQIPPVYHDTYPNEHTYPCMMCQMYQLWAVRVDGGNGKELYGEDYADIYAINRLHFKAGTNGSCDHVRSHLKPLSDINLGFKESLLLIHEMLCFVPMIRPTRRK